jgi:hypothetical protein
MGRERAVLREGKGWRRRLMTLIWCAGRGRVTLTSASLADWAGLPGCAAAGQPSRRRGRRPGGVRSRQRRRLPRRNALYRGEHCRVDRVPAGWGTPPATRADRWASTRDFWGPHLRGPLATSSKPARSAESSAERAAPPGAASGGGIPAADPDACPALLRSLAALPPRQVPPRRNRDQPDVPLPAPHPGRDPFSCRAPPGHRLAGSGDMPPGRP